MTKAEGLLKALTDEAAIDFAGNCIRCIYCDVGVAYATDLENTEYHKPDCPWRLAKEYLQEKEA